MEYTFLPVVDPSKAPRRPVNLPNIPVVPHPERRVKIPTQVPVHPAGRAPKTKPIYGMTKPYVAGIHGVDLAYTAQ